MSTTLTKGSTAKDPMKLEITSAVNLDQTISKNKTHTYAQKISVERCIKVPGQIKHKLEYTQYV